MLNRRGFLSSLGALVATTLVPLPRAARVNPVAAPVGVPRILTISQVTGCSLTRACIQPLTPAMLEQLAAVEIDYAQVFARTTAARAIGVVLCPGCARPRRWCECASP